jgi:hypothetical protein
MPFRAKPISALYDIPFVVDAILGVYGRSGFLPSLDSNPDLVFLGLTDCFELDPT